MNEENKNIPHTSHSNQRNLPGEFANPGLQTTPHSWIDAGRQSATSGLPRRVQFAPAVWLCCVYLSSRVAERIDADCESSRRDSLLRAAADAWRRQHKPDTNSCVFQFQPDAPGSAPNALRSSSPGFLIRLQVEDDDNGDALARLEFAG